VIVPGVFFFCCHPLAPELVVLFFFSFLATEKESGRRKTKRCQWLGQNLQKQE
jgi:hypothetical protein